MSPGSLMGRGQPCAPHVPAVSGAADVSAYLISCITRAPTSQPDSATQASSVQLVVWRTSCFTKSHKCDSAAASPTGGGEGIKGRVGEVEAAGDDVSDDLKNRDTFCEF